MTKCSKSTNPSNLFLPCHCFLLQDNLVFNAAENFSLTQSPEDFSLNQDFPFNMLQEELRSHGSQTYQDLSPEDPFLDLVASEDLPPKLFPSLHDSTFPLAGDLHHEGSLKESDIM